MRKQAHPCTGNQPLQPSPRTTKNTWLNFQPKRESTAGSTALKSVRKSKIWVSKHKSWYCKGHIPFLRGKRCWEDCWGAEKNSRISTQRVLRQGKVIFEGGRDCGGQVGIKNCECGAAFCWQIVGFLFGGFSHTLEALRCAFLLSNGQLPIWEVSATWGWGPERPSFFGRQWQSPDLPSFVSYHFCRCKLTHFDFNKLIHFRLFKYSFFRHSNIPF